MDDTKKIIASNLAQIVYHNISQEKGRSLTTDDIKDDSYVHSKKVAIQIYNLILDDLGGIQL